MLTSQPPGYGWTPWDVDVDTAVPAPPDASVDFVLAYIADTTTVTTDEVTNVTVISQTIDPIDYVPGSCNNIGALLAQADRINEQLAAMGRHPELSQEQRAKVLHVMKLANVDPLGLDPALWAALCGVPTQQHPWGPQIANGIIHWAARYYREAMLGTGSSPHEKQGPWLAYVEIRFGWFLLPGNNSKARSLQPPQHCDLHWFPCVYFIKDGYTYMICVHLLIYLMGMWCVHPQRLAEWV